MIKMPRIFGKSALNAKQSSDAKLWSSGIEFDEAWKNRIALMASYIDIPGEVADFGCGMMWLEQFLKTDNIYIPIDYIKRDDRTHVVDLNVYPLPVFEADVVIFSGVLEYIESIDKFYAETMRSNFKKIILSYCTLEKHGNIASRKSLNWVSHESVFSILAIFTKDYDLTAIDDVNTNTIMVFNRKNV